MRIKLCTMLALTVLAVSVSAVAGTYTLTFSEFPVGTIVTTQYAADGVTFSGVTLGPPIIANDGAMPFSPVLSPNPVFAGDFNINFPSGAYNVSFQSGYWDTLGSGVIDVYNTSGGFLGSVTDTGLGPQFMDFSSFGTIGHIYFNSYADPFGADIDNLTFTTTPELGTLLLLGSGLLGTIGVIRRKINL